MSKHAAYQQKEDERKKKAIFILVIALVAVLSIGGTLAYLTATTNTKSNVFTSTNSITAVLFESTWDGGTAATPSPTVDSSNTTLGVNQAKTMTPGKTVPKNPVIQNTNATGGESEYVAMRVTFYKKDSSGTRTAMTADEVNNLLVGLAVYDDNTNGIPSDGGLTVNSAWVADSGNSSNAQKIFYYASNDGTSTTMTSLATGTDTAALFQYVGIISGAGNGTYESGDTVTKANYMSWLAQTCPGGFEIEVDGAAVQTDGITSSDAQTTLNGLFA